jgi:hypothetical protein
MFTRAKKLPAWKLTLFNHLFLLRKAPSNDSVFAQKKLVPVSNLILKKQARLRRQAQRAILEEAQSISDEKSSLDLKATYS